MNDYEILNPNDLPKDIIREWVPEHRLIADLMWAGARTWAKLTPRRKKIRSQIMLNTYALRMGAKIETFSRGKEIYVYYLGPVNDFRAGKTFKKLRERREAGCGAAPSEHVVANLTTKGPNSEQHVSTGGSHKEPPVIRMHDFKAMP